jgi:transcriptional regulator with XRE-family HTH domain
MKSESNGLLEEVGNRIRLFRKKKGMSQEELGVKLGLTKSYISRLETGKKPISLGRIETVASVLEVNVDYLLVDKTRMKEEEMMCMVKPIKEGDQFSRKNFIYTVISVVPHENRKEVMMCMIKRREFGSDEVDYFVESENFFSAFRYEGNIKEEC